MLFCPVLPFIYESQTHTKDKCYHARKYKNYGYTKTTDRALAGMVQLHNSANSVIATLEMS